MHTPKDRLIIYNKMYKLLKASSLPCVGFCLLVGEVQRILKFENKLNIHNFPELMSYKPRDQYSGFLHARWNRSNDSHINEAGYWFRRDWLGKQYRLWILRKIIKELTQQLEE